MRGVFATALCLLLLCSQAVAYSDDKMTAEECVADNKTCFFKSFGEAITYSNYAGVLVDTEPWGPSSGMKHPQKSMSAGEAMFAAFATSTGDAYTSSFTTSAYSFTACLLDDAAGVTATTHTAELVRLQAKSSNAPSTHVLLVNALNTESVATLSVSTPCVYSVPGSSDYAFILTVDGVTTCQGIECVGVIAVTGDRK